MKLLLSFIFSIVILSVSAQDNPVIENSIPYQKSDVLPVLDSLHQTNDYVVAFRTTNPLPMDFPYFILAKKGSSFMAFTYSTSTRKLEKLPIHSDSLNVLWRGYIQFKIFEIKDEKELFIYCPDKYYKAESYTYEILLLSGEKMKRLSYYDPEYFDRVCNGMKERRNVIDFVSLTTYVMTK